MTKITHGILIDPAARTCTIVNVGEAGLHDLYDALQCDMVEMCCHQENSDAIYVDEEGLFKVGLSSFNVKGAHQPFVGRGLILGHNDEGECTAPKTPPTEWINRISFYPQEVVASVTDTKEFCPFDLLTGLKAVALEIAYDNGCIHRGCSEAEWLKAAAVPVMLVPIVELIKLDEWLKTLDQDHLELLAAGEQSDMEELQGRAPDPELCNTLLNQIMEA